MGKPDTVVGGNRSRTMLGDAMTVREVLKMLEANGWRLVATRGSHRQYKHPQRPGRVTVAGKPGDDLPPGMLNRITETARS